MMAMKTTAEMDADLEVFLADSKAMKSFHYGSHNQSFHCPFS